MDLNEFIDLENGRKKVYLPSLPKGTEIFMFTKHSLYRLQVIDPKNGIVIASGGYFRKRGKEPCETFVNGSTMGGSMIFNYSLIEGLFCEFQHNVLTSRITCLYVFYSN